MAQSSDFNALSVTYEDKVRKGSSTAVVGVTDTFRATDANEVKNAINNHQEINAYVLNTLPNRPIAGPASLPFRTSSATTMVVNTFGESTSDAASQWLVTQLYAMFDGGHFN